MLAKIQASLPGALPPGLLLITMRIAGADLSPIGADAVRNAPVANPVPCDNMTAAEVLASRYPDPEALIAPERCKERARQLVQKWRRQQDLDDLKKLASEACAESAAAPAQWLLTKELVKLERQSILAELPCACSAEILSQGTNPPAPPPAVRIATDVTPRAENTTQNAALTPIGTVHRFSRRKRHSSSPTTPPSC